jgi:hypothetical protein
MINAKLDLKKVFQSDADEIINAQKKSKLIHSTKNIKSSGNEVETKIREIISKRLPKKCSIGQGHIVDKFWSTSSQLDIVLFDNITATPLFISGDDTSYFPYESVYGFGEIKSTYYRKQNPLKNFIDIIKELKTKLRRNNITNLSEDALFTFMFFVDSNNLDLEEISELYLNNENKYLPNVVCFLNKGVIVRAGRYGDPGPLYGFNYVPEFENLVEQKGITNHWQLMYNGDNTEDSWFNLIVTQYLITSFINLIPIKPTELLPYLQWAMLDSQSLVFKKDN